MLRVFRDMFRCSHKHKSAVFTPLGQPHKSRVVCLECGTAFQYDWNRMKQGKKLQSESYANGTSC